MTQARVILEARARKSFYTGAPNISSLSDVVLADSGGFEKY